MMRHELVIDVFYPEGDVDLVAAIKPTVVRCKFGGDYFVNTLILYPVTGQDSAY
jgi:hypothetical protein